MNPDRLYRTGVNGKTRILAETKIRAFLLSSCHLLPRATFHIKTDVCRPFLLHYFDRTVSQMNFPTGKTTGIRPGFSYTLPLPFTWKPERTKIHRIYFIHIGSLLLTTIGGKQKGGPFYHLPHPQNALRESTKSVVWFLKNYFLTSEQQIFGFALLIWCT